MTDDYTEKDLEDSLRRAFKKYEDGRIIVDGHALRNRFLVDGVNYGRKMGYLIEGPNIEDQQYFAYTYELTEKGKDYLCRDKKPNSLIELINKTIK